MSAAPNADDALVARVSRTRGRWLPIAVGVAALGAGGVAVAREIDQRTATTEADWSAAVSQPVIAGSSYSLVGVNLRGEERPLVDVPSENAEPTRPNAFENGYFAWPKISPDGKRIALEVPTGAGQWDIWVYDEASRSVRRLTHGFTGIKPFGWSSDSRNLVYLAVDDGDIVSTHRVVSQRWDRGASPRQLLQTSFPILNVAIGPLDGPAVIRPTGDHDLWIASLRSPATVRRLAGIRASAVDLDMSRDGRLLAYVSDESGQNEVYVVPLSDPSGRVRVSQGGGSQPVWSPDGRHLFYRGPGWMMRAAIRHSRGLTVERAEPLFADVYERHDVTNYDVFPSGEELVMIRARSR
jgi:eukaryotic-like serine/threonine-protein kinase